MRLLFVALAIIVIGLGLLAWSGSLDGDAPAVQVEEDAQDRFEVDSGMASESDPAPAEPQEGP